MSSDPDYIEKVHIIVTQLRDALRELADNEERSPQQIKDRLNELAEATDGLCEVLKDEMQTEEA